MNFKRAAILVATAGFIIGAGSSALAEHDPNTRAGQFCGQNEHGLSIVNDAGDKLTCSKDGNYWRWVKVTAESETAVPVTANPGLTG